MSILQRPLGLLLSLLLLFSCGTQEDRLKASSAYKGAYFDLKAALAKEVDRLEKENPLVLKTVVLNGQSENLKDTVASWEKELVLFSEADLNQPVLAGEYEESVSIDGTKKRLIYKPLSPGKVKVQKLLVELENDQLMKVMIQTQEENILFKAYRNLELNFQGNVLRSYSVEANQAINYGPTTQYIIKAKVTP